VKKSRGIGWKVHVARMGETINAYSSLVGKPEGRSPGRPRRRWKDNIRMDLRDMGREGVDWLHLAYDKDQWRAVVNMVMKLRVPWGGGFLDY
jgi:hypothetical protein